MANFWGGCTPPRHSGTWVGARVASLRCHYPPPRRRPYSRNAEYRPHQSKTSCRGGHRRGTTTSGPGRGPLAGFAVTFYGRFSGDRRGFAQLAAEVEKGVKAVDRELLRYQNAITSGSTGGDSISTRIEILTKRLATYHPRFAKLLGAYHAATDEVTRNLSELAAASRDSINAVNRSEEHTSELQSRQYLVC